MTRVDPEILTIHDLATMFGCDKETAAARLTNGDLPGVKVGRSWIIPRQALFERLNDKAREEATARRELHANTLHDTGQRAMKASALSATSTVTRPSVIMSTTTETRRGRKRREPPTLPSLPKSG
jgi:hypothetical protein